MVKPCKGCNKDFLFKDGRKRYCSDDCRDTSNYLMNYGGWVRIKRRQAIEKLGGACVKCGFTDFRSLDIDHVLNNGAEERKTKSLCKIIYDILNDRGSDYQVLCKNCNYIKYQIVSLGHFN